MQLSACNPLRLTVAILKFALPKFGNDLRPVFPFVAVACGRFRIIAGCARLMSLSRRDPTGRSSAVEYFPCPGSCSRGTLLQDVFGHGRRCFQHCSSFKRSAKVSHCRLIQCVLRLAVAHAASAIPISQRSLLLIRCEQSVQVEH